MTDLDPRGLEAAAKAIDVRLIPNETRLHDMPRVAAEACVRAYLAASLPPDGENPYDDDGYPDADGYVTWGEGYAAGFAAGRAAATPDPPDAADLVAAHLRERWPCTCRPGMDGGGVYHAADCNSRREGSQAVLAVIRLLRAANPPASHDERLREALEISVAHLDGALATLLYDPHLAKPGTERREQIEQYRRDARAALAAADREAPDEEEVR